MVVTLINAFTVPPEREQEFIENWKRTTDVFSRRKGFIDTNLHRNTGVGSGAFLYVNIARWESTEAWDRTHGDYRPTEDDIPGVVGHPAIYESVITARYQGED